MTLGNMWAFPSATMSYDTTLEAMKALASRIARLTGGCAEIGHPLDIAHVLEPECLKAAADVSAERKLSEPIPKLCALVVASPFDAATVGYYFDVRHAVVEGGDGGWRTALDLVSPRLSMISLKDFFWEKSGGSWQQHDCPIGEGMVDWKRYFATLAKARFHGPVSLHIEYDIAGDTPAAQEKNTLVAAERDFAFVKARIAEAYSGAPV